MKDPVPKFSAEARRQPHSALGGAFALRKRYPGIISLGSGNPPPSLFPYSELSTRIPKAPFSDGIDAPLTDDNSQAFTIVKQASAEGEEDICLDRCLQYSDTRGENELLNFVKEHIRIVHDVPYPNWDAIISIGSSGALNGILHTLIDPGDVILVEEFTFAHSMTTAKTVGAACVPVKMDLEGLLPEALDLQLEQWVGRKPKFLYTIPTGQNPTGSSLSVERREKIYQICLKHDIMIVEDDPYYFLQMPTYGADPASAAKADEEFPKSLIKSFLSMDTEGIVIRTETFSKLIAPGMRLGYIVGHPDFIAKLTNIFNTSVLHPAGISQSIVNGTLQRWGQEGFLKWLAGIRHAYTAKRDNCVSAIKKYLPSELYEMDPPVAGMFAWLKLNGRRYKSYEALGGDPQKITEEVYLKAAERNVLVIPGHYFRATDNTTPPQPTLPESEEEKNAVYYRLSFSTVPFEDMDKGIQIFGDLIREFFS